MNNSMQIISTKTDTMNNRNTALKSASLYFWKHGGPPMTAMASWRSWFSVSSICTPNDNAVTESTVHFEVHIAESNMLYLIELINACLILKTIGIESILNPNCSVGLCSQGCDIPVLISNPGIVASQSPPLRVIYCTLIYGWLRLVISSVSDNTWLYSRRNLI